MIITFTILQLSAEHSTENTGFYEGTIPRAERQKIRLIPTRGRDDLS